MGCPSWSFTHPLADRLWSVIEALPRHLQYYLSQRTTKPTIRLVRPAKISLRIRAVWSESSLITCAFYSFQALWRWINENSCHTGWMYRLIWVFAGHTGLIVGFVMLFFFFLFLYFLGKCGNELMCPNILGKYGKYSKPSMARTSLQPWKFIRDMGSSRHWRLIIDQVTRQSRII